MVSSEGPSFPITVKPQNTVSDTKAQCMTPFMSGSRGCKPRETEGRRVAMTAEPEEELLSGLLSEFPRVCWVMKLSQTVAVFTQSCKQAKCPQVACVGIVDIMLYEF